MDCTDLKYATGFFDVVIDKSNNSPNLLLAQLFLGTIDALCCGPDPDLTVARMTKVKYPIFEKILRICVRKSKES